VLSELAGSVVGVLALSELAGSVVGVLALSELAGSVVGVLALSELAEAVLVSVLLPVTVGEAPELTTPLVAPAVVGSARFAPGP
jgi:hypothetical protein